MQPLKRRSNKATDGAAADYLEAKLGWLHGFPAMGAGRRGLSWIRVPRLGVNDRVTTIEIDAERIRRTEFGRNRAAAKFPAALPRIVGDLPRWRHATDAQLRLLKAALYDNACWPDLSALLELQERRRAVRDHATRFAKTHPLLSELAQALAWMTWRDDRALGKMLRAANQYAQIFERIAAADGGAATALTLRVAQLAAEDTGAKMIEFFSEPYQRETEKQAMKSLEPLLDYLENADEGSRADGRTIGATPSQSDAKATLFLSDLVETIAPLKSPARKRAVALFESVAPIRARANWARWRAELTELRRDTSNMVAEWRAGRAVAESQTLPRKSRSYARTIAAFRARAETLKASIPPPTPSLADLRALLATARKIAVDQPSDVSRAILDATRANAPRDDLLASERRLTRRSSLNPAQDDFLAWGRRLKEPLGAHVFVALARFEASIAAADPQDGRPLWRTEIVDSICAILEFEKLPRRLLQPFLETVRLLFIDLCASDRPTRDIRYLNLNFAVPLLRGGASPATAMPIVRELNCFEWENGFDQQELIQLFELSGRDIDMLGQMLSKWRGRPSALQIDDVLQALNRSSEIAALARQIVLDGEINRLLRFGRHLLLCHQLKVAPVVAPPAPRYAADWSRYPAALNASLRDLEASLSDAETVAAKILKPDFPNTDDLKAERAFLETEIASLDAALISPGLKKRREALSAQIAAAEKGAKELSPARLAKYERKIRRRAHDARFSAFEEATGAVLRAALSARVSEPQTQPPADWFEDPETLQVLAALEGLPKTYRTLGWRAVRARLGPRPWDLRDALRNRAYLRRLEKRGVDAGPWLDGLPPRPIIGAERALTLAFENDPVEILKMGAPFSTCLAPGSFNYFSAVANAVDINKRVLYARDGAGVIRARCLFALSSDPALVLFRVYAHEAVDAVTTAVAEFARDLASRMGVAILQDSLIPTLVAPRWYDDGPVDLTGDTAFFKDADALEAWFAERPIADAPAALRERIGAPILPSHLVALATSPALRRHPERFAPFAPLIGPMAALDPETRLELADALTAAGVREQACELLDVFTRSKPPQDVFDNAYWRAARVAEIFLRLNAPSRALRALRVSRPSAVRDWSAEAELRALAAARAFAALHRRSQAVEIAEMVRRTRNRDLAHEAAQLLAEWRPEDEHPDEFAPSATTEGID